MRNKNNIVHVISFVLIFIVIIASAIALLKLNYLEENVNVEDGDRLNSVEQQVEDLSSTIETLENELAEAEKPKPLEGPLTISANAENIDITVKRITLGQWLNDTYDFESRLWTLGPSATEEDTEADIADLKDVFVNLRSECSELELTEEESDRLEDVATLFMAPYSTLEREDDVYVYEIKYLGASQDPDTYTITAVENYADFSSIGDVEFAMNQCFAGGDAYPNMVNGEYIVFTSSCGTGYSDGSGDPIGCTEAQEAIEVDFK